MIDIIYRYTPDYRREQPPPADAEQARLRLEEGNRAFAELFLDAAASPEPHVFPFDLRDMGICDDRWSAPTQAPFAVVLGCSDARAPTEMVFSQACNDLFVVRVAGNVLGHECLGSIDYAVENLRSSVKLVLVLGHSQCGAVTAAVDAFLDPTRYLSLATSHALRSIVDRLFVAVRASAQALEQVHGHDVVRRPGYCAALIETAIVLNAAITAFTLQQEERDDASSGVEVRYGVYDLVDRRVGVPLEEFPTAEGRSYQLALPPANHAEFLEVARRVAGGTFIGRLLDGAPQRQ